MRIEVTLQPDGERVVAGLCAALHRPQRADAVGPAGGEARTPGTAEKRVVPVDEPRQVVGAGMGVAQRDRHLVAEPPLVGDRRLEGTRVLEVLRKHVHVGVERPGDGRRQQAIVRGRATEDGDQGAVAEQRLPDRPVGAARAGEVQARNARIVDTRRAADDGSSIPLDVVGKPEARLEHLLVRRDRAIGRERVSVDGLSDERGEKHLRRRRDRVRLDLRAPAQSVVHRPLGIGLPGILRKEVVLVLHDRLGARLVDRERRHAGELQIQHDRPRDRRSAGAGTRVVRRPVGALHVAGALRDVVDEPRHTVERHAAVGEADERLVGFRAVPLSTELEEVAAFREREVVEHLEPRVMVLDRQEERHPEAECVHEVHVGVLERRPRARVDRSVVRPRPVLARILEPDLVGRVGTKEGVQAAVDGVGVVALQAIGGRSPRIKVELAVLLLRPGVVVLQRQVVPLRQMEVELHERRARVVGACDRPEVLGQGAIERGAEERRERVERRRLRPGGLLRLVVDLLVVGKEVERLILLQRAAQGEAKLVLREIRIEFLDRPAGEGVLRCAGEGVELAEVVQRAVHLVGAGLGDHVHETGRRTPELGVRAVTHDDDFPHGVEVEGERRSLAAALLSEERVVEVRPVDGDVVVNAPLPRDRQLVAVRPLHDRHIGREQRQVEVVAPIVGKAFHRLHREPLRRLGLGGIHHRLRRFDAHGLQRDRREREAQVDALAHPQRDVLLRHRVEPDGARRDLVGPEGQQRRREVAPDVRCDRVLEVGLRLVQQDLGTADRCAVRVDHDAADDAGRRLGLSRDTGERQGDEHGG